MKFVSNAFRVIFLIFYDFYRFFYMRSLDRAIVKISVKISYLISAIYPPRPSSREIGESAITFLKICGARLTVGIQTLLRKNPYNIITCNVHTKKHLRINFLLFVFLYLPSTTHSTEHWIFIHGTFAKQSSWHKPFSTEYKALFTTLSSMKNKVFTIHSFEWTGEHNEPARMIAAENLVLFLELIKTQSQKESISFHLIAHSHGATVALLTAEKLFRRKSSLTLKECFTLGMPVYENWYPNAHKQIETLYNFFSYGDAVQKVGMIFERTLTERSHVHNIQLIFDYSCPGHLELYNPTFITQLPTLHTKIAPPGPYKLQLFIKKKCNPILTIDTEREKELAIDKRFTNQLIHILADSRKIPI